MYKNYITVAELAMYSSSHKRKQRDFAGFYRYPRSGDQG